MDLFSKGLTSVLKSSHRQQEDFRLDDIAARIKKRQSQGQVYNIVFMLSGILSLIGGGMVNVNIQLASLKERVREVGVKMAIGASGREVFKEFMTEALLLTSLGGLVGFVIGVVFSKVITEGARGPALDGPPELRLGLRPRPRLRLRLRDLPGAGRPPGSLRWKPCGMSSVLPRRPRARARA